jgi:hypothetical protein
MLFETDNEYDIVLLKDNTNIIGTAIVTETQDVYVLNDYLDSLSDTEIVNKLKNILPKLIVTIATIRNSFDIINNKLKGIKKVFRIPDSKEEYTGQSQGGGRKSAYKSTKQKVSVIFKKKSLVRTIYKNAKGVSYIKVNNQYKLLSKFKV